ncbi:MAG: ribosome small subunit-dependent GTPase A [Acutalibacteraceae bacterium]|nr:ribosome small subunit-dependent GTPase A [Oscillospiraceae bacterium]
MQLNGIIIKGIGGFYYVEAADRAVYECKAKGIFRKKRITPLAGDHVEITIRENGENTIDVIEERKNSLVRPQVANVDNMLLVSSVVEPKVNTLVLDKMIAIAEKKKIEPIIVFSKSDLSDSESYVRIYRNAGFRTFAVGRNSGDIEEIKLLLKDKVTVLAGNTGVGKSTLINRLAPELKLATGEISDKLGRGRHTTRQAELFPLFGGYVIDTPGFSSIDLISNEIIMKDELQYCFREFEDCIGKCMFVDCSHVNEKGCKVLEKVRSGEISESRHASYAAIYNEIKDIKHWQL